MIATRDLKDSLQVCDVDSDCSGESTCSSETRTCHEKNYVEYDYCYIDEMEAQNCIIQMENLAVNPWNLKVGQEIDINVVVEGNCDLSNPTKAVDSIEMYDVWSHFVKPENYRTVAEEFNYL
jgi:hypothetical protein